MAERVSMAGLAWWRQDARIFGYGSRRNLESLCWVGANLIPVHATTAAIAAFAEMVAGEPRGCSSIVGSAEAVLGLWSHLAPTWGPSRDVRPNQPLMAISNPSPIAPDPGVRLVRPDEIDMLFPAAVAMYTEEVGVSPTADGGERSYRERIAELIRARRAYARFHNGRVIFKAELAVVTKHTAQIQGVWTDPELRGHGLATAGIAAVVRDALRRVAPSVSLYVNDYNLPARRVYERCGFQQVGTFATVLF
ncbi:GNAT family N-acetyltransferase [Dactylosporangium matsuzakiense]|uniref:N-acetyltransferase GCN5 n=1 Tax=Dactylosporangium matsuzakiense TaxID=53360 RepID=A0A9W6KJ00_9ACTN|nr:N-acetyltransferase GCN5 [Dactylosporangium matsuzakiense]